MTAKDIYYPIQAFVKAANAGVKPSTDIEDVLKSMGAKGIGLGRGFFPNLKITHARNIVHNMIVRATLPSNKIIVLQYPMQYHIRQIFHTAKNQGNKVIIVVHDVNWLRDKEDYNFEDVLSEADVIIAHTPAMKRWLSERFQKPEIILLNIFDYIQQDIPSADAPSGSKSIVFAGNLGKSTFLRHVNFNSTDTRLVLYGVGCPDELAAKSFVDYKGSCMPEEIPTRIASNSFGLVWDGSSINTCDGGFGKYLQYNAPYKLSSYMAAGIPVIVWNRMGIADFVTKNGIGITVDSLDNLEDILSKISDDDYNRMRDNTKQIQEKVSTGFFSRMALEEALTILSRASSELH